MLKSIFILGILFLSLSAELFGQQANNLMDERVLKRRLDQLRSIKDEALLPKYNDSFKAEFLKFLDNKVAFDYPFSMLTTVGKVTSNDGQVRVFSWNVQLNPDQNIYNCIILKKKKRRDEHEIYDLKDNSVMLPMFPKETLDENNWYGALYYDIVEVTKGRKTYYTLLGYDLNNSFSHIKLLDVLYFNGRKLNLGYPLFETEEGLEKRVFMEHSKKATMTLRYDERRRKIVFDHLSPESPTMKDFREYYVPDMSYDAYKFVDEVWVLETDIIATNAEESNKLKISRYDAKNDTIVEEVVRKKWNSPDGGNTPVQNGSHEAQTVPEEEYNEKNENTPKSKKEEKVKPQKEEEFGGVQYGNLGKGKRKRRRK
ncbi:hypothetical protein [Lishizhenia sp.]|uniref:hypothetical protein n=1 Tax=Lishizhenia sp. TaxID=2497594 RepID=UPI00299DF150|nr:hypothetical protein [Lishizhenia sp.]MDX1447291.1 hypothetical protein [Lishizhenia sp.]